MIYAKIGSPEFEDFLHNFEDLYTKIKSENPYAMFFAGDFNGHSQLWWPGGDTTPEGTRIEGMTNFLGLTQLIAEPTNFEPHKTPSCLRGPIRNNLSGTKGTRCIVV